MVFSKYETGAKQKNWIIQPKNGVYRCYKIDEIVLTSNDITNIQMVENHVFQADSAVSETCSLSVLGLSPKFNPFFPSITFQIH